jgi:hypothetical protein
MSNEAIIEQEPEAKDFISLPIPKSFWGKLLYGLFIAVMPIFSFWVTDFFKPEWQTGNFSDYLILFLFPEASLLFFFLLAYSIVSYCLLLIDSVRYSQKHFVRFGVYAGVLLAVQYSVLLCLFFINQINNPWGILYLIVVWMLPLLLPRLYSFLVNKWEAKTVNTFLGALAALIILISMVLTRSPLTPFVLVLAGATLAAPFWCLLMLLRAAVCLFKNYEFRLTFLHGVGLAAWTAGYVAAWRFDILKMYELYAALPPQPPPDCYIATAAAQGHPRFVGSWIVEGANGETMRVNQQLQILKCAELACMAVQPRLHGRLRRAYDVIGKPLAKKMRNPVLGDIGYLLLKPVDGLARFVLRIILPEIDLISSKMYMNEK